MQIKKSPEEMMQIKQIPETAQRKNKKSSPKWLKVGPLALDAPVGLRERKEAK